MSIYMAYSSLKLTISLLLFINIVLIYKIIKILKFNELLTNKNAEKPSLHHRNSFYKELFKLYIENRKKFYVKGREYIMKTKGKIYNESNILTIQDKLNYLLIHESPENKTGIVDKILLRNYSKIILGKDICAPILKIYNNVDEINLDDLPDKFVLKCNHGSGMNLICEDKSKFNLNKAKYQLKQWMNINYGLHCFEYQYINIEKKVFAEKFLEHEIVNYKFSCFNGEPKFIRVKGIVNGKKIYNINFINWTSTNIELDDPRYIRDKNRFKRPINLVKMVEYSRLLSSNFCYCRVDFYEVKGELYLGELTFSPFNNMAKYKTKEMEIYLGSLLNISKFNNTHD